MGERGSHTREDLFGRTDPHDHGEMSTGRTWNPSPMAQPKNQGCQWRSPGLRVKADLGASGVGQPGVLVPRERRGRGALTPAGRISFSSSICSTQPTQPIRQRLCTDRPVHPSTHACKMLPALWVPVTAKWMCKMNLPPAFHVCLLHALRSHSLICTQRMSWVVSLFNIKIHSR
jgi:hypothetical protein